MVKKQPDKFERMIDDMGDPPFEGIEVYAQFRQYHREVVELVKNEKVSGETGTEGDIAYNQAIDDILTKLKEFTK